MKEGVADLLIEEYEAWQRLGRGQLIWDVPVIPEPYFYPFFGHGVLLDRQPLVDNGRRDTWITRLSRSIGIGKEPEPPQRQAPWDFLIPIQTGEAPEYLYDSRSSLYQAQWLLHRNVEWNPKKWESLLYSLSASDFPICLEIVGTEEEIVFRWIVEEYDRDTLEDAMKAANIAVRPDEDRVEEWISNRERGQVWGIDLALRSDFLFPIKHDFRLDPYVGVLAAISHLEPDQMAVIQILFSPCECAWSDSIWRSITLENGRPFFEGNQMSLQLARKKCSQPLFAANVRLAFFDSDMSRDAPFVLDRMEKSFGCFNGANGFDIADRIQTDAVEKVQNLLRREFRRSGMILNASELFALVHPPAGDIENGVLKRTVTVTRRLPEECNSAQGLLLGINEHWGETRECRLNLGVRSRHLHVLGASGTGKSTFMLNCMIQDLEEGHGFALLDPHGDLTSAVLDRLPEHRVKDVVLFDPADAEWPMGFNILRAYSDIERNLLASDFVAIFERLSSSWGDQMTAVLGNAALAFLESDRGGTLVDLKRFLIEKGFRENFLPTVKDPEVQYFWRQEFPLLRGTTQGSLLTRLSGFLRHRLIRNMVAQDGERFDVAKMMDEGKVILAPLSQGLIGQENSWLLGSLLVSRFYQAALSRQSQDESTRRPFWLYLDEAHQFYTPSIGSILSGTRKYGLGLILAHQELDQFPSRESGILSSILTNCHTRVYFRLGDKDASKVEPGFSNFGAEDFLRLGVGEALCRVGGSGQDFNLGTPMAPAPGEAALERRARAIEHSRKTYATPRSEIEARTSYAAPDVADPPIVLGRSSRTSRTSRGTKEVPVTTPLSPAPVQVPQEPVHVPQVSTPSVDARPEPTLDPTPVTKKRSTNRSPGRGGAAHKQLQQMIKGYGNGLGLRATIEAELPGRTGLVDVLLEGSFGQMAFEVADSSPIDQEIQNIKKCVDAAIAQVFVVSDDPGHLAKIRDTAESLFSGEYLKPVRFISSSELSDVFAQLGAQLASIETSTRGYKVRVKFSAASKESRETAARQIHKAVADGKPDATESSDCD